MPTLVIVRHGQSQWNLENRFTGWVDVELTAAGEAEARAAGQKLKGYQFDEAYTSNLRRAQNTLQLILEEIGAAKLPIHANEALNERHYGDLAGLNKDETRAQYGDEQVRIWRRSYDTAPPNGESLKDTAARVLPYYFAEIEPALLAGKNLIVVAHGNSLRALMMHLEGITPEEIPSIEIPTAAPKFYELDAELKLLKTAFL